MKEDRNELKASLEETRSKTMAYIILLISLISFYTMSLFCITVFATVEEKIGIGGLLVISMIGILAVSLITYSEIKKLIKFTTELTEKL